MALIAPLAHAGHWINAFLYLSPVLIIGGLLWLANRRENGAEEEDYDDESRPQDDA